MRATHANRGKSLETIIIASQAGVVALEKMPTGARMVRGKWMPMKSPVDFIGTIVKTGRAIVFDAKQCHLAKRWDVGHRDHLSEHQRQFLIRQGHAGAVAGVLIEAANPNIAQYFWCSFQWIGTPEPSMAWDDGRLIPLGQTVRTIDFRRIPGVDGRP